jgi:hypothetical protein
MEKWKWNTIGSEYINIESYKKMNELFNRRQNMEFKVHGYCESWIHSNVGKISYYLWHDGTIRNIACSSRKTFSEGWWKTKEEAEQFLRDWLPQKEWLSKDHIKDMANWSDKIAHSCSINHWKQMILNFDDLRSAFAHDLVSTGVSYCALCTRHLNKNTICTLKNKTCKYGECVDEWCRSSDADLNRFIDMYNKLVTTYNDNFGEKKMDSNLDSKIAQVSNDIKLLEDEKKKLEDEKKKKEQYIFVKGDLAVNGNAKRLIINIDGKLAAVNGHGNIQGYGQSFFEWHNYKKIGRGMDVL